MGRNNKKKAKSSDTNGGDHKTDKDTSNSKLVHKFAPMTSDKSVKYSQGGGGYLKISQCNVGIFLGFFRVPVLNCLKA